MKPGDRVLITDNPHHARTSCTLGTVVALRQHAGFAGLDLIEVEYEDPLTGDSYVRPFDPTSLLTEGELLERLAARYENLAVELRRMAEDVER